MCASYTNVLFEPRKWLDEMGPGLFAHVRKDILKPTTAFVDTCPLVVLPNIKMPSVYWLILLYQRALSAVVNMPVCSHDNLKIGTAIMIAIFHQ